MRFKDYESQSLVYQQWQVYHIQRTLTCIYPQLCYTYQELKQSSLDAGAELALVPYPLLEGTLEIHTEHLHSTDPANRLLWCSTLAFLQNWRDYSVMLIFLKSLDERNSEPTSLQHVPLTFHTKSLLFDSLQSQQNFDHLREPNQIDGTPIWSMSPKGTVGWHLIHKLFLQKRQLNLVHLTTVHCSGIAQSPKDVLH